MSAIVREGRRAMRPRRRGAAATIPMASLALDDAKDLVRCIRRARRLFTNALIDAKNGDHPVDIIRAVALDSSALPD